MRARMGAMVAGAMGILWGQWASACLSCQKTPCVVEQPRPRYECVTELEPYTVMKSRTRIDYQQVQKTVMSREPIMQTVERQRVVCRKVYDTTYSEQRYLVNRTVTDTSYVDQQVTVCRPVTSTRQVAVTCMQPVSRVVSVPAVAKKKGCGLGVLCGKHQGSPCSGITNTGCVSVVETCYQPTTMMREVIETQMVSEVQTRRVPVHTTRCVTEERVRQVPVRQCRTIQEVVVDRRQVCVGYQCVPKTITKMVPVKTCETVPVTKYKKVKRMVAVCPAPTFSPMIAAATTLMGIPSPQAITPSAQGSTGVLAPSSQDAVVPAPSSQSFSSADITSEVKKDEAKKDEA